MASLSQTASQHSNPGKRQKNVWFLRSEHSKTTMKCVVDHFCGRQEIKGTPTSRQSRMRFDPLTPRLDLEFCQNIPKCSTWVSLLLPFEVRCTQSHFSRRKTQDTRHMTQGTRRPLRHATGNRTSTATTWPLSLFWATVGKTFKLVSVVCKAIAAQNKLIWKRRVWWLGQKPQAANQLNHQCVACGDRQVHAHGKGHVCSYGRSEKQMRVYSVKKCIAGAEKWPWCDTSAMISQCTHEDHLLSRAQNIDSVYAQYNAL